MGFLIDTCIWIDVEQRTTNHAPVYLSRITIAELRFGVETAADPGIRQKRKAAFRRLQRKPLLPIDGTAGEVFGDLAAHLRTAGGSHRYRVQDIWLASQAIQHGFGLLTRNKKDFDDIPGLNLLVCANPPCRNRPRITKVSCRAVACLKGCRRWYGRSPFTVAVNNGREGLASECLAGKRERTPAPAASDVPKWKFYQPLNGAGVQHEGYYDWV
jgi:predicted nucleic acid-binding protein